jgi:NAD(P)-dependent dehydrogenase (short-subunit alcohol dehydrogenase family)
MGKLDGKVAIVTGAGTGVGRGIAAAFAKEGADLAICGRRLAKLEEAAEGFTASGAQVLARSVDVMERGAIDEFVAATVTRFGRLDILVNNACTIPHPQPLEELTVETWYMPMKSGLDASFFFMQACFAHMKDGGGGKIINVSSGAGIRGIAGVAPYAAAKAGIDGLTRVAAIDWAPHGIRVNSIAPFAMSEAWEEYVKTLPEDQQADPVTALNVRLPAAGYVGDAEADIGRAAVFLASRDSDYITGHILPVDGGMIDLTV